VIHLICKFHAFSIKKQGLSQKTNPETLSKEVSDRMILLFFIEKIRFYATMALYEKGKELNPPKTDTDL
jgi:hypothetical protein